ncbi:MAG: HYExAFE family protein [Sedimentisphaerales bacterium]|nr:HYExAFE family protein [Sedimentisphaerales bacterium]
MPRSTRPCLSFIKQMIHNGTHYEKAFEALLQYRQIPYTGINQARKAIFSGVRLKSFDFLIYPPRKLNLIADVKGRKFSYSSFAHGKLGQSWTTFDDVQGLQAWQKVFGEDYIAVFIFAYWLEDIPDNPAPDLPAKLFNFEDHWYYFTVVELDTYQLVMHPRSPSWQTVYIPARLFRKITQPIDNFLRPMRTISHHRKEALRTGS